MESSHTDVNASVLERDPVTFEVVKSALYAICAEMKSIIMRTSFSPLLSLSADLSCALLDERCNVIAQGEDIPCIWAQPASPVWQLWHVTQSRPGARETVFCSMIPTRAVHIFRICRC